MPPTPEKAAAVVLDDFNRANEGPPPSASWTTRSTAGLIVLANQLARQAAGAYRQDAYWNVADYGPDVEIVVDLAAWTDTNGNELALQARIVNIGGGTTDAYSLNVSRGPSSTEWAFSRYDNDVGIGIGTPVVQAVAAGDKIAFQIIGQTLFAWHKPTAGSWTLVTSVVDATYAGAGKCGVEITNNQQTLVDNWRVATIRRRSSGLLLGVG